MSGTYPTPAGTNDGYKMYMSSVSGKSNGDRIFLDGFSGDAAMKTLTFGLMFMAMFSHMMISDKRRKRETNTEPDLGPLADITDSVRFYAIINELDEDDCIALALCHVSSVPEPERTREQIIFSEAFRLPTENPLSWDSRNNIKAKYQYASYIGRMESDNTTQCSSVFPKCLLGTDDILRLIVNSGSDICSGAQRIDPDSFREDVFNAFLAKRRMEDDGQNV